MISPRALFDNRVRSLPDYPDFPRRLADSRTTSDPRSQGCPSKLPCSRSRTADEGSTRVCCAHLRSAAIKRDQMAPSEVIGPFHMCPPRRCPTLARCYQRSACPPPAHSSPPLPTPRIFHNACPCVCAIVPKTLFRRNVSLLVLVLLGAACRDIVAGRREGGAPSVGCFRDSRDQAPGS